LSKGIIASQALPNQQRLHPQSARSSLAANDIAIAASRSSKAAGRGNERSIFGGTVGCDQARHRVAAQHQRFTVATVDSRSHRNGKSAAGPAVRGCMFMRPWIMIF
jgi:hypothetical protein